MIRLDNHQKGMIKSLLQDERWGAVMVVLKQVVDEWNAEPVKADTEFETIWRTASRESKVAGLKTFFNILEDVPMK